MEETEPRPSIAGGIALLVGAVLIVVAVGFLTFGLYSLIHFGIWPHYPASKMLSEIGVAPRLSWEAGQRALEGLLAVSACVFLFVMGGAVTALGAWIMARHHRRQKLAQASA